MTDEVDFGQRVSQLLHKHVAERIDGTGFRPAAERALAAHTRKRPGRARIAIAVFVTVVTAGVVGVVTLGGRGGSRVPDEPPNTAVARVVEAAVIKAEMTYVLAPGSPRRPVVTYVVTSAPAALRFLGDISWSSGFYSTRDCGCHPQPAEPIGEVGITSAELSLIADERGSVALVELSGIDVEWFDFSAGGPACPPPPAHCTPPITTAFEAPVAFLVVNLADGFTTGGMIATPMSGTVFPLDSLGSTTSWMGPSRFGRSYAHGRLRVERVDNPHATGQ